MNGMIPSSQRATILSFDSLMNSTGGVWTQPVLGRAADAWGYAPTYVMSAGISLLALPFIALSRRQGATADLVAGPLPAEVGREVRNEGEAHDEPLETGDPVGADVPHDGVGERRPRQQDEADQR